MLNVQALPMLTPEEYLEGERRSDIRHEFIDGQVYAMAGASERHNRIAGNAFFQLRAQARGGSCGVFMSDMKLRIAESNCLYYPDVMLTCDPEDDEEYYKQRPCLLIEVSSPSTAALDRREKWLAYKQIADLRYYLIISADQRRVEIHFRDEDGVWRARMLDDNEMFTVRCPGFEAGLSMDGLYEDVRLADQ